MTTDLEDRLRTQAQKIADEGYHRWSELCVEVADALGSQADRIQALEAKCAELERDAGCWRLIDDSLSTDELKDIAVIVAAEHGINVAKAHRMSIRELFAAAIAAQAGSKEGEQK